MEILSRHALLAHAPKTSHTYKNSVHGSTKHTHKFSFSRIFDERTTQKEFFDESMLNTVKDFIDGQNCLIFTYGVTNSGKTYTVQGMCIHINACSCGLFLSYFSADNMIGVDSRYCKQSQPVAEVGTLSTSISSKNWPQYWRSNQSTGATSILNSHRSMVTSF